MSMGYEIGEEMMLLETENRIRNLVWTVSGDYSLKTDPDVPLFFRSEARALYRAVCQGAYFRCFDAQELSLYILKKLYYQADEAALSRAVSLCMDAAVWEYISRDRRGIVSLRRRAAEDFVEQEFGTRSMEPMGQLELLWHSSILGSRVTAHGRQEEFLEMMQQLGGACTLPEGNPSLPVIRVIDAIYNGLADPSFVASHGDLDHVLAVTLEELAEAQFDWKDFLAEEAQEAEIEDLPDSEAQTETPEGEGDKTARGHKVVRLDEETRQKAYSYMELNYGRSYMDPLEQRRLSLQLCRGIHEGCSLYFTEGILDHMVRRNYQVETVRKQFSYNKSELRRRQAETNRNIRQLAAIMSQAMIRRNEIDEVRSVCGQIRPPELWRVGRTADTKLFTRRIRQGNSQFVVDILMDASGSQHDRRGNVAVQGYIISEALSRAGIPHRVQSFCTCWDYTILQRFRQYDDPMECDRKILEFSTSANNRDGLAIKTVVHGLMQRPEDNKILIVLSDGKPNDRIVNRTVSVAPALYVGAEAVKDTAEEVRRARNMGVAVLGVFAGKDEDLDAEKRIFGRDFAYIRDIRNFSHVVGRYLKRQIDLM